MQIRKSMKTITGKFVLKVIYIYVCRFFSLQHKI